MSFPTSVRLPLAAGALTALFSLLLIRGQDWAWQAPAQPHSVLGLLVYWSTTVWVLPVVPALLALIGCLLGGRQQAGLGPDEAIATEVCFRVVTRGANLEVVQHTVANIYAEMAALPLFPHRVQVVSELLLDLPDLPDLELIVVPRDYRTKKGSLHKARALQYVLDNDVLAPDVWVVHLDEESHIRASTIRGIRDAVQEEEASGRHRVGQGCILYHRDIRRHPFLTLADSLRTADDFGRFRLQFRLGLAIFGLHGSFILVRNSVEKRTGFDFGPEGSVTEDTYWALVQMASGTRFRWVNGYVVEQSTQSVRDFLKQRRRWFVGVAKVVRHGEIGWAWKAPLAAMLTIWACIWVSEVVTVAVLASGFSGPPWVRALGDSVLAAYLMQYLIGCHTNLEHHYVRAGFRPLAYAAQLLLVPFFAALEALGALYGLIAPDVSFHVVRK